MFMHNYFLCCISNLVYVLVHGNILMCYTCIPFIYVDVHLKTIFAVTLALVSEDGVCCKVVFL